MNRCLFSVVIVAYNPDVRLVKSISSLLECGKINDILVVDNSTSANTIIDKVRNTSNVTVISNNGNKGIAYAQNVGVVESQKLGYNWVLTLDHDTIIDGSLITKYINYIQEKDCSEVGILATDYFDISINSPVFNNSDTIEVHETISSGSLLNISIYNKIGGLKIYYFIDQVDNEYCYRVINNGYKIVVLPGIGMEHRLGNMERRSFLGYSMILYNQSPIRTFYRTRNIIWMLREYNDRVLKKNKILDLFKDLVRILFEKETAKKYVYFIKGVYEGLCKKYE